MTTSPTFSRRTFLQTALAGLALPLKTRPFLSVGICGSVSDHYIFQQHGYQYVEPSVQSFLVPEKSDTIFDVHVHGLHKVSLPIPVANGFLPSSLKVVGSEANHEAVMNYVNTVFQRAQRVGIEQIIFGSGGSRHIPDGFSPVQAEQQFVSLLKKMGALAHNFGITVCLEPLRRQETNFLNTVPEALACLQKINHPAVELTCDVYHILQEGGSAHDVHLAGDAIRHCHIAENKDRAAPGVHGEDFSSFFTALKAIGYKGRISVECRWTDKNIELPAAVRTLVDQMARI